jgi:hypothetical protein
MTTQSTANAQYGALGICYHLIFQIQLSTLLFVGKVPLTALTIHPSLILNSQAGPGLLGLDQLPFRNDIWHHPCKGQGCTRSVLDCNDTRAQRLLDYYGLQLSPRAASEREI